MSVVWTVHEAVRRLKHGPRSEATSTAGDDGAAGAAGMEAPNKSVPDDSSSAASGNGWPRGSDTEDRPTASSLRVGHGLPRDNRHGSCSSESSDDDDSDGGGHQVARREDPEAGVEMVVNPIRAGLAQGGQ
jgi:hypothetical protein